MIDLSEPCCIWVKKTTDETCMIQGKGSRDFVPSTEGWGRLVQDSQDKTRWSVEAYEPEESA